MTSSLIVQSLGWALLHNVWETALVALVARVALGFVRTAWVRFAVAWSGLVLVAGLFVATLRIAIARALVHRTPPLHDLVPTMDLRELAIPWLASFEHALPWIVGVWCGGVVLYGLRASFGFIGVAALRARARVLDTQLKDLCEALVAKLEIAGKVVLAECDGIHVPAVVGWLRPLVLLPIGFANRLEGTVLEAAIAHELAHVRRHDYLLNAVATALEAIFFHHPCVWWLAAVARCEREHACDDLVVEAVQTRRNYAHALWTLERLRGDPLPTSEPSARSRPAPMLSADGSSLLVRIQRLKTPSRPTPGAHPMITFPSVPPRSRSLHRRRRFVPSWAPLFAFVGVVGLAALVPSCAEVVDETAVPTERIEGTIAIGDAEASLDLVWLPTAVERHAARIEAAARRHGVDPDLLAIIVLVESSGDPQAESPTGARGLMQLMPDTADWIARKRSLDDHRLERLSDPDYNLDLGAWFLARQLEHWGSIELASVAYNGGEQAAEGWLAADRGLNEETDRYRSRVTALWHARHAAEPPR